jgi:hypothetical protein
MERLKWRRDEGKSLKAMTEPTVTQREVVEQILCFVEKLTGKPLTFRSIINVNTGERSDGQERIESFVGELLARTRAEAEAAMLLAAADAAYIAVSTLIKNHDSEYALDEDDAGNVAEKAILALQSSDAATALARRDAETRLDEAKWWLVAVDPAYRNGYKERIAELTRPKDAR